MFDYYGTNNNYLNIRYTKIILQSITKTLFYFPCNYARTQF